MGYTRQQIAERAAAEVAPGTVVNLGIGLPTMVADFVDPAKDVWIQSENGLLGMGPFPYEGEEDPQLINAGKQTVTAVEGASIFDSSMSFAMIRGGHIDLALLGAMQVSARGDLANWAIPGGRTMGIGGAMDLASGAKRIIVLTTHRTRDGKPKLVQACDFPLTATRVVSRIITDMGVIDIGQSGFELVECAPGVTEAEIVEATGAPVQVG